MTGLSLRFCSVGDMPLVLAAAGQTGWDHLSPLEQERADAREVAHRSAHMIRGGLAAPGGICIIGETEGQPVAYEVLLLHPDEFTGIPTALKLDGWVAPAMRGRGINQQMHQASEAYCRQMGVARMTLAVAVHNAPALRATERSGFVTERYLQAKWLV